MNVNGVHNGIVLDHIKAGTAMTIYNLLQLDKLNCCVAIIQNVDSKNLFYQIMIFNICNNFQISHPLQAKRQKMEYQKQTYSLCGNSSGRICAPPIWISGFCIIKKSSIFFQSKGRLRGRGI